jgi:hypothetical protein
MMRQAIRWGENVLIVVGVGVLLSCGGAVREGPRPASGAATIEELVAVYREAHLNKDPERLRKIDLTLSLLADWIPMNQDIRSRLLGLFELDLEEVRVVEMPLLDPRDQLLGYVRESPDGEVHADILIPPDLYGRLVLIGRRPDAVRVELDPGFGVGRLKGRLYVEMLAPVTEDAAKSVRLGTNPHYRLIPHGTYHEFSRWESAGKRTWAEGMRKLDELERKAKDDAKKPKEACKGESGLNFGDQGSGVPKWAMF